MHQAMVEEVLDDRVAGSHADDGKVIVLWRFAWIGRAAGNALFVVIAIHVDRQYELTLAILTIHSACSFFGSDQHRQQKGRKYPNNRNHHQQFNERKGVESLLLSHHLGSGFIAMNRTPVGGPRQECVGQQP